MDINEVQSELTREQFHGGNALAAAERLAVLNQFLAEGAGPMNVISASISLTLAEDGKQKTYGVNVNPTDISDQQTDAAVVNKILYGLISIARDLQAHGMAHQKRVRELIALLPALPVEERIPGNLVGVSEETLKELATAGALADIVNETQS